MLGYLQISVTVQVVRNLYQMMKVHSNRYTARGHLSCWRSSWHSSKIRVTVCVPHVSFDGKHLCSEGPC